MEKSSVNLDKNRERESLSSGSLSRGWSCVGLRVDRKADCSCMGSPERRQFQSNKKVEETDLNLVSV